MEEKDKAYLRMDCLREAVKLAELTSEHADPNGVLAVSKAFEEFVLGK